MNGVNQAPEHDNELWEMRKKRWRDFWIVVIGLFAVKLLFYDAILLFCYNPKDTSNWDRKYIMLQLQAGFGIAVIATGIKLISTRLRAMDVD